MSNTTAGISRTVVKNILNTLNSLCYLRLFFISNALFSTKPKCCMNWALSWIERQMLLRCCLIHITIITLWCILYLVYLCPCLDLGQLMSYLCDLFLILSLIFIFINHITTLKQTYLLFVHCFRMSSVIFGWKR